MKQIKLELTGFLKNLESKILERASVQTDVLSISDLENMTDSVVFILNNGLFDDRKVYQTVRKDLIENNRLKAVVALKPGLLHMTNAQIAMLVLGESDGNVYMVDATGVYHTNENHKILSDDDISKIVSACKSNTEISRHVLKDEIIASNYQLDPICYFDHNLNFENPVTLKSITKKVICGIEMNPTDLKNAISESETSMYAFSTSDLNSNAKISTLKYLKELDSYLNHKIINGSLIISKFGDTTKVKIANFDDANVIAVGRMYILELDTDKVNPYYVKAFLESECGQYELNNCKSGVTITKLDLTELLNIQIPLLDVSTQNKIVESFCIIERSD